jgi:K+-transporting ATPase ATPase B chain
LTLFGFIVDRFIILAAFSNALNFMGLATPQSAILSAVIFNALIIIFLIPRALRGVPYRPVGAAQLLRDTSDLWRRWPDCAVHRDQAD